MKKHKERASTEYGRAWLHYLEVVANGVEFYHRKFLNDLQDVERIYIGTDALVEARDNAKSSILSLFDSVSPFYPFGKPELKESAIDAILTFDQLLADAEEHPDKTVYFNKTDK